MSNIYRGHHIEQQPQQLRGLTVYLARLIGLTVILLVAGFVARGSTLIMATIADGPSYLSMQFSALLRAWLWSLATTSGPVALCRSL